MTLDEAARSVGRTVFYLPPGGGRPEYGVITEVRSRWVFVKYGDNSPDAKATLPQDLRLLQELVRR